ncbi:MAG: hypothetical protein AB2693_12545 [Candidatus Thiodiazotropha sp.]
MRWQRVYGEEDVFKRWHRQFRCDRTSVETAPIPERPQFAIDDATLQRIETAILDDRCITVRQLAHEVKINVRSVDKIIHDHLHMGKVSARWIPG